MLFAALVLARALPATAQTSPSPRQEFAMSPELGAMFERGPALPATMTKLSAPVQLRFGPAEHFSYGWAGFGNFSEGRAFLTEGFVIEGSIRAVPEGLVWRYRLSNLGHDRVLRQWAEIEATTDLLGKPSAARVLSKSLPDEVERVRPASYGFLDPEHFQFPLCCLPQEALRQGDRMAEGGRMPEELGTAPGMSVVRGVVLEGGRTFLVLEQTADLTVKSGQSNIPLAIRGVTRIDVDDPLRRTGTRRLSLTVKEPTGKTRTLGFLRILGDGHGDFLGWR